NCVSVTYCWVKQATTNGIGLAPIRCPRLPAEPLQFTTGPCGATLRLRHIESLGGVGGLPRYPDVVETLKQPDLYSSKDWIINALGEFSPVPRCPRLSSAADHARLRRLANRAFTGVTRAMEPGIRALILSCSTRSEARGGEFDFVSSTPRTCR
ncbi:hypothetical protein HBB16_16335, partial [Pseudonocardia sp. MCCB 268]|nr:hypothetical protein [Pseudonocardia cytotoxica]